MKQKRAAALVLVLCVVFSLALYACKSKNEADYTDAAEFEKALNEGRNVKGKTVRFQVEELSPDSPFGFCLLAGEHLNFCSLNDPGIKEGQTITVKVTEVTNLLGSWVIYYKLVDE